jgi:predicted flap endonuclease-1-like 5' DNA nuclease
MPYTLSMGLLWYLLALVFGGVIGWLLRSVVAGRQVARARAARVDKAEMERLKGRVANLEPLVAERDRLVAELEGCRSAAQAAAAPVAGLADLPGGRPRDPIGAASVEPGIAPAADDQPAVMLSPVASPDVAEAAGVLGHPVVLDDLQLVEGIGPKIEELCIGIGIRTWFDLATTEVSLLRTMLADAGARFKTHDPGTWPEQARLLAHGDWEAFKQLTDELSGGRRTD